MPICAVDLLAIYNRIFRASQARCNEKRNRILNEKIFCYSIVFSPNMIRLLKVVVVGFVRLNFSFKLVNGISYLKIIISLGFTSLRACPHINSKVEIAMFVFKGRACN